MVTTLSDDTSSDWSWSPTQGTDYAEIGITGLAFCCQEHCVWLSVSADIDVLGCSSVQDDRVLGSLSIVGCALSWRSMLTIPFPRLGGDSLFSPNFVVQGRQHPFTSGPMQTSLWLGRMILGVVKPEGETLALAERLGGTGDQLEGRGLSEMGSTCHDKPEVHASWPLWWGDEHRGGTPRNIICASHDAANPWSLSLPRSRESVARTSPTGTWGAGADGKPRLD